MQGRRRPGKGCLNSEFVVFQSSSRRIPTRLFCQMYADSPGMEFLISSSKFRKKKVNFVVA